MTKSEYEFNEKPYLGKDGRGLEDPRKESFGSVFSWGWGDNLFTSLRLAKTP